MCNTARTLARTAVTGIDTDTLLWCRLDVDVPDYWWIGYNRVLRCYTEPFLLQFCDRRVVHRSNELLGNSYGRHRLFRGQCLSAVLSFILTSRMGVQTLTHAGCLSLGRRPILY